MLNIWLVTVCVCALFPSACVYECVAHMARTISCCPLSWREHEREQKAGTQVDRFIVVSPLCHFNEFSQRHHLLLRPSDLHPLHSLHKQRPIAGGRGQFSGHSLISMMTCAFPAPPCLSFSPFPLLPPLLPGNWVSAQLLPLRVAASYLLPTIAHRPSPIALAVRVVVVLVRGSSGKIITHMPNG